MKANDRLPALARLRGDAAMGSGSIARNFVDWLGCQFGKRRFLR